MFIAVCELQKGEMETLDFRRLDFLLFQIAVLSSRYHVWETALEN